MSIIVVFYYKNIGRNGFEIKKPRLKIILCIIICPLITIIFYAVHSYHNENIK